MNGFLDDLGQAFDQATVRDHDRRERRGRHIRRAATATVPALLIIGTLAVWSPFSDRTTEVSAGPASGSATDPAQGANPDQPGATDPPRSEADSQTEPLVLSTPPAESTPTTTPPSSQPEPTEPPTESSQPEPTEPPTESSQPEPTEPPTESRPCGDPIEAVVTEATTDGPGPLTWVPGLTLTARSADGQTAEVKVRNGMTLGVAGGRYQFQIDYMPDLGASEQLVLHFEAPICGLQLSVAHMARNEYEGLDETLSWVARDDDGSVLATGSAGPGSEQETRPELIQPSTIVIDIPTGTTVVELGAAPYGPGPDAIAGPNNSDWALVGVSTAPID